LAGKKTVERAATQNWFSDKLSCPTKMSEMQQELTFAVSPDPGWPDELVKKTPKVLPNSFVKINAH
jgi:hypothetical protein